MNVAVEDLYAEIGRLTVTLRVHESQAAQYEARIAHLERELVAAREGPVLELVEEN